MIPNFSKSELTRRQLEILRCMKKGWKLYRTDTGCYLALMEHRINVAQKTFVELIMKEQIEPRILLGSEWVLKGKGKKWS